MAYTRKKITTYGAIGAVIATIVIVAFLSTAFEEERLVTIVELESVMPGTLAITIITDTPNINVTELKLTIDRFEVRSLNGNWTEVEILEGRVSFDLFQRQDSFIDIVISQLEPESMIRMHMMQGLEYVNATLNNGEVVGVELPNDYIELWTPIVTSLRVYIIRI